jgi:hypothetical protein
LLKKLITFLIIIITFTLIDCDNAVNSNDIDNIVIPDSNVSYSQYIQPVFNIKCVNCHGVGITEGNLDLTTWSGTIADPSVVFPGEPENSKLVWIIEGRAGFPPMPPIGSPYLPLTENQIKGVRTWISEGAKNN